MEEPRPARRGRPRKWGDDAAKHREHRRRQAAISRALGAFIHAVYNARLPNPELQRQVNAATDDLAVLEALTAYYRARRWQGPVQPD